MHALTFEEQQRILAFSAAAIGDKLPLINGVYADGSIEAARIAAMAEKEGASALLVFPPNSMGWGGAMRPEMALAHFKRIGDATDLPIILFQYPATTGLGYPFETLLQVFEKVPTIRAMKDWCADPLLHEKHIRTLQGLPKPVNLLTTHSGWLMASLSMGANGLLSGAGSVVADLQVALFEAVKAKDLGKAQRDQRPALSGAAGVLRAAVPRHAQPHEGMPGDAQPHEARGRAPAADEAHRTTRSRG